MTLMDQALNRRSSDWYLGRVLYVTDDALPPGWVEGYYRALDDPGDGTWRMEFLGFDRPRGVPVYVHNGRDHDLKAIPITVVPALWRWAAWTLAYLMLVLLASAYMVDATGFVALICLPILAMPLWDWYYAVEPVRATKVAIGLGVLQGGLALRRHFENHDYLNHHRYGPGGRS